jgi:hypothetical protein
LKATKILGTKTTKAIAIGSRQVQQNVSNWSNLILGRVALNHTKIKQKIQVLSPRIIDCILIIELLSKNSGIL